MIRTRDSEFKPLPRPRTRKHPRHTRLDHHRSATPDAGRRLSRHLAIRRSWITLVRQPLGLTQVSPLDYSAAVLQIQTSQSSKKGNKGAYLMRYLVLRCVIAFALLAGARF